MPSELRALVAQMKRRAIHIRGALKIVNSIDESKLTRDAFFQVMELRAQLQHAVSMLVCAPNQYVRAADIEYIVSRLPPGSFYDCIRSNRRGFMAFRSCSATQQGSCGQELCKT